MDPCVLMVKQEVDQEGPFYKAIIDIHGQLVYCLLRSDLKRAELLKRLYKLDSLAEIYSLDQKALIVEW